MENLKSQIWAFYWSFVVDQKREEAGHKIDKQTKYHMIFRGNPGTGKTKMGRMMAKLMKKLGVIQQESLKVLIQSVTQGAVAEHLCAGSAETGLSSNTCLSNRRQDQNSD